MANLGVTNELSISIHALREEGDPSLWSRSTTRKNFYPRPPRGGRPGCCTSSSLPIDFYPRPPRGGRPGSSSSLWARCRISIHALREEGDPCQPAMGRQCPISIHALREEGDGHRRDQHPYPQAISIHALREEGDSQPAAEKLNYQDFYPRPPRGGRPHWLLVLAFHLDFYPRPPRGGRRKEVFTTFDRHTISIHALREEGDSKPKCWCWLTVDFYPRPPRGGRRLVYDPELKTTQFLSTPSARRATVPKNKNPPMLQTISIHALREEGDRTITGTSAAASKFLSTPSARRATLFA